MQHVQRRATAITDALTRELIPSDYPIIGMVDLDTLDELYHAAEAAFDSPSPVTHAVAAKAVTLVPMMRHLAELGSGCEVASPGELQMALLAGFTADRIVFDSPAKTRHDIDTALDLGVAMNLDNFTELARIDEHLNGATPKGRIGVRINPQLGAGSIAEMSTATPTSKFGIPLRDEGSRQAIIDAYASRPWLNQIHVHSGSQGMALSSMAAGVRAVVDLVADIHAAIGRQQITHIDIGGGLPVNFDSDAHAPSFADYRAALEAEVPELFDGTFGIITEFGRSLLAKSGTMLTRVESTKVVGGRPIAVCHAGAQVAARTIFMPNAWPLRVSVFDPAGTPREADVCEQDVAGPCCFSGDIIAHRRQLPRILEGDVIAIHDVGAYYFSNSFSYNALPRPAVYGYREKDGSVSWVTLRRQQTIEEVVAEAGGGVDSSW